MFSWPGTQDANIKDAIAMLGKPKDAMSTVSCSIKYPKADASRTGEAATDNLSRTLPASKCLQLPGPDIIFTYIIVPNGYFYLSPLKATYALSICTTLWQGTQQFNNPGVKNELLFCSYHLLASFDDFWFLHWKRPRTANPYFPLCHSIFHRFLPSLPSFLFWNPNLLNY